MVTVLVTLLLIPALLVTGTGVDLATMFSARAAVRNGNELALNAVLSDYDQLLRDLYGLFAVTKDDAELQAMVNRYISLTLFGEDNRSEGRIIYNNISINAEINPVDDANLMNQAILRRQIEEYVRLRAPLFMIEEVLDSLEKFTRFLPDLYATILKLEIVEQLGLLQSLQQQLYYRMFYHERYLWPTDMPVYEGVPLTLADIEDWIANADKNGLEVTHAALITADLSQLGVQLNNLNNMKNTFFNQQDAYETAVERFNNILDNPPSNNASDAVWDAWFSRLNSAQNTMDNARNAMNNTRDTFYQQRDRISEGVGSTAEALSRQTIAAVERGGSHSFGSWTRDRQNQIEVERSEVPGVLGWIVRIGGAITDFTNPFYWVAEFENQRVSRRGEPTCVEAFLDNLVQMETLFPLIERLAEGILEDMDNLERHLIANASSAMREGLIKQLEAIRPSIDIVDIRNQYNAIVNFIDGYFLSYAAYLANPDIRVNDSIMTPEQLRNIIQSANLYTQANSAEFNALRQANIVEAVPYSASDRQANPFMGFTDDDASFEFFIDMYNRFGDETYFMRSLMDFADNIGVFFSSFTSGIIGMIQDLTSGLEMRGRGAPYIPRDIYVQLMGGGTGMEILVGFQDAMSMLDSSLWTMVRTTITTLRSVRAIFGIFLEEDGILNQLSLVSYATGMFSSFTTQSEKSFAGNNFHPNVNYLLGWEQEYLLIGDRRESVNLDAFNSMLFATRFVFNFISSFVVPTVSGMVAGDFTQITRIIFVLMETYVDIFRLRSGNSVPIVKVLDQHWIFGNPKAMGAAVANTRNALILGTVNSAIEGLLGVRYSSLNTTQKLKTLNAENIYKNGILYIGIARTVSHRGLAGTHSDIVRELENLLSAGNVADNILTWTTNFDPTFNTAVEENAIGNKINKILSGDSSKASDAMAEKIANDVLGVMTSFVSAYYHDYLSVFLFFVPSSVLVDRMQHLITLNMTNTVQNSASPEPPRPTLGMARPPALSLDIEGLFDLSQAHTAFTLETEADLHLLFLSSFIAQGRANNVPGGVITFETVSNRGY